MKRTVACLLAVLCLAGCLLASGCTSEDDGKLITLEEYNQIETGMSYDEVVDIIGSEGEVNAETGKEGDDMHVVIYSWKGKGEVGANAIITFSNGEMQTKAQAGLK